VAEISKRFPATVPIEPGTWSSRVAAEQAVTIRALIAQWREETKFTSSVEDIIFHPAYQRVMAKGKAALNCIFQDLEQNGGFWFWALQNITEQDPVLPEHCIKAAKEAWLAWGREHQYL